MDHMKNSSNDMRDDRAFEQMSMRSPGYMPNDPAKVRDFRNLETLKDSVDVSDRYYASTNNPYAAKNTQMNARKMRQFK